MAVIPLEDLMRFGLLDEIIPTRVKTLAISYGGKEIVVCVRCEVVCVGCLTRKERRKKNGITITGLNQLFYQLHQRIHARREIFWCEAIRNGLFPLRVDQNRKGMVGLPASRRSENKMRAIR